MAKLTAKAVIKSEERTGVAQHQAARKKMHQGWVKWGMGAREATVLHLIF